MALRLIVIVLVTSAVTRGSKNAGMLAFVSNHGTDDVVKATSNYYAEHLLHKVYKFQDMNGTFKVGIWNWEWSLSNIQFQKVSKPYSKAWTDRYLHIVLNDLSMDLTGDFDAYSKHKLFKGRGQLHAHVCFHLQLALSIGINNTVKVEECFSGFDCPLHIEINMQSGDYPDFLNGWIQDKMQNLLRAKMICDSMSKFATNYPIHTVIHDPGFAVDLSVKKILGISHDGIAMAVNGEVFDFAKGPLSDTNPMYAPKLPSEISFNRNKMTTFVISSYAISTLFLTSERKGLLDEFVNTELLPPDQRVFYSTTCKDVCIGNRIPQIGKKFPGQFVSFKITALETIKTQIDKNGIALRNGGDFTFFVGNITLFTMRFHLSVNATPFFKPNTVIANFILNHHKFDNIFVDHSKIGHIPEDTLELITQWNSKVNILPKIHRLFDLGLDFGTFINIPHKDKLHRQTVHFIDVEVKLRKGMLIVSADFTLKIKDLGLHTQLNEAIRDKGRKGYQ